jgi:hypothetical protein
MSKPLLGLILGVVLGAIDGATAWFYPEARPMIMVILIGSTVKGLVTGILIGFFARKVHSIPMGLLFGLGLGLFLGYMAAMNPTPDGQHNYLEIMVPGAVVGAILGYATQKYGKNPVRAAAK